MSSCKDEDKPPAPPLRLTSQNQPTTPKHQLHQLNQINQQLNLLNQQNLCVNYLKNSNQFNQNNQQKLTIQNHIPVDQKPLPKEPLEIKENESKSQKKSKQDKASKKNKKHTELTNIDKPVISPPTNFEHVYHIGFNADTGEFNNLPQKWAKLLKISNISKIEQKENPQAVIDVLKWYDLFSREKFEGFGVQAPKYMHSNAGKLDSFLIIFFEIIFN